MAPDVTTGTDRNSNLFAKQAKGVRGTAVARLSLAVIEPVFLDPCHSDAERAQAGGTCFFANSAHKSRGLLFVVNCRPVLSLALAIVNKMDRCTPSIFRNDDVKLRYHFSSLLQCEFDFAVIDALQ